MADYIIAENLKAAYLAQQDAAADAAAAGTAADIEAQTAPPPPIPQSIRTAYVQEVEDQVQAAQAQAAGQTVAEAVPGALSPNFRVFQSYSDVEATDSNGQECALTGGDFVRREDDTPDSTKTVTVTVVTVAKPSASHCVTNAQVRIAVDTLQDWYNSFAESQQAGFDAMASNQGKNGFPAAPDTARVTNPDGQGTPDDPNALAHDLQDKFPHAHLIGADRDFEQLVAQVVGFIEAPALGLDLPLDVRGTAFQQRVWQALRDIPAGSTTSYAEIAARIGSPKAVRAVAQACAANSLAVAIPCHRVIRSDGSASGYRWGVERKLALLERENRD